jgi:hypothetical protein
MAKMVSFIFNAFYHNLKRNESAKNPWTHSIKPGSVEPGLRRSWPWSLEQDIPLRPSNSEALCLERGWDRQERKVEGRKEPAASLLRGLLGSGSSGPAAPWPLPTWQALWLLSWHWEPSVLGLHHRVNNNLSELGEQGSRKWRNSDNI